MTERVLLRLEIVEVSEPTWPAEDGSERFLPPQIVFRSSPKAYELAKPDWAVVSTMLWMFARAWQDGAYPVPQWEHLPVVDTWQQYDTGDGSGIK